MLPPGCTPICFRMASIPTLEEEDRKRPNREHQKLSGEKTRMISRVKGTLVRLGIRNFNGNLRYAADRLKQMRTPEGVTIPPTTMAKLERGLARLRFYPEAVSRDREDARDQAGRIAAGPAACHGVDAGEGKTHRYRDRRHAGQCIETCEIAEPVARYAGMTGSSDDSGAKRREKGLAKAGNSRVRRGMLQLAWRNGTRRGPSTRRNARGKR